MQQLHSLFLAPLSLAFLYVSACDVSLETRNSIRVSSTPGKHSTPITRRETRSAYNINPGAWPTLDPITSSAYRQCVTAGRESTPDCKKQYASAIPLIFSLSF